MNSLQSLFSPKSIAVVGASRTPHKLGHDVLKNVKQFGFTGKIYPVNPQAKTILGLPTMKSVTDIPGSVDVAIIMVPAQFVASVLRECGEKKVKFAVIISAGFREIGKAGMEAEQEIIQIAKEYGIALIGPNCLGYIHTKKKLNASFAQGLPKQGNVSLVSQSGAMGVAMLDWAQEIQLGFSKIVSIGNKADISELELLEYFGDDPETEVIMMYLESINQGREFINTAARITPHKPIIVLKAGTSEQARQAVSSHTGSLAGESQVVAAAFERAGIIQAHTVEEFFDYGFACSTGVLPRGSRCTIVTNAGGPGIMAVDAAPDTTLQLPTLSIALQKKLATQLPASASTKNPVDLIGDALPDRYAHALHTVLASKESDSAIVILTPQVMTDEESTAQLIIDVQKKYGKPVMASFMGGSAVHAARNMLEQDGIAHYDTPERAVRTLGMLSRYVIDRNNASPVAEAPKKTRTLPSTEGHIQIRTREAERILKQYGLPVLSSTHIRTEQECANISTFPVVAKVASRDVVHKAASGAIQLNIHSVSQLRRAFRAIKKSVGKVECEGIIVQQQIQKMPRCEVIIGMKRDPSFGPVILFGLGGSTVELYKDVACAIAPLSLAQAKRLITRVTAAPLITQFDTNLLAQSIVAVSQCAVDYPEITQLDINPMLLFTTGGKILDVRMLTV